MAFGGSRTLRSSQHVVLLIVAAVFNLELGMVAGLDNGMCPTPPLGFNSFMSGLAGEAGLTVAADFFRSSGMQEKGFVYINTDEGWEEKTRDAKGNLQWDSKAYPSGLPTFIDKLHDEGFKYGIYGAASGVTCGQDPGQLYHEANDAATYVSWGVDYLKSDNCASYALDSSVRFAAMRDGLNATGKPVVLSIEPFSISPDPEQSIHISNLARVYVDISSNPTDIYIRADVSDKWAPLAGPGYFNDPDMINLKNPPALSLGMNRIYFGLWAIMKAPLLLSSNFPKLQQSVIDIMNNTAVIAVNQDPLGVQARKLEVNGTVVPWLVGIEDCRGTSQEYYSRNWNHRIGDTRIWNLLKLSDTTGTLVHNNTGRCLTAENSTNAAVLLPCDPKNALQHWLFDKGFTTVTTLTSVALKKSLAVSNSTLYAAMHAKDKFYVSDAAYGMYPLALVEPYDQQDCESRDCQNYDPSQMWFYSAYDGKLRHSLYTSSINHFVPPGKGYTLTEKVPTWRHHCLAEVLSNSNIGTPAGETEVWGGPLSEGAYVMAAVNRGSTAATITIRFSLLQVDATSVFSVTSLWDGQNLGRQTGEFVAAVGENDIAIFTLQPITTV